MRLVFGVDGGASKTLCLLGTEKGEVLALGRAGPSNHQVCGLEAALGEIGKAVGEALQAAGAKPEDVKLGAFFLAGADFPEDYELLREGLEKLGLCRRILLKNDTLAALRAGASRPWGVVVVCGTGFNAAGRAPDGREIVLPGLGPISGDLGGGAWIAREVIRRAMRAWDGRGKSTVLLDMALEHLDYHDPESLIRALYRREIEEARILGLVPLLFEAAYRGDEVACGLVREVGTEVGITARALIRRLGLQEKDVEVVLAGGVFKGKGPLLLDTVRLAVHEAAPRARIIISRYEPVVGAFLSALEALGVAVKGEIKESLEGGLPEELFFQGR